MTSRTGQRARRSEHEFAAEAVEGQLRGALRLVEHERFEIGHDVAEGFEGHEVAVHDHVHERGEQLVGALRAQRPARAEAVAHRVEHVAGVFEKGEHPVVAQHEAHLLHLHVAVGALEGHHREDDVEVVLVHLQLGALPDVGDVLPHEPVEPVGLAELLDEVGIVDPIDEHPRHAGGVAQRAGMADIRLSLLVEAARVVAKRPHLHGLVGGGVARVGDGAGRFAVLARVAAQQLPQHRRGAERAGESRHRKAGRTPQPRFAGSPKRAV